MRRLLVLVVAGGMAAGCGGPSGDDAGTGTAVTVLAASSLTDALTEVAGAYEDAHEGTRVELSFDGSSRLAAAIVQGAPADVFASADEANLERVIDGGRAIGAPTRFATSRLQIVVPAGNPLGIASLADLYDVTLALCAAAVPCGAYAVEAFERAGVEVPRAGDQENVKGVLTQVQLGEADAGLVYDTDVLAADGVDGVDLAPSEQVVAGYVATAIDGADDGARSFLAFLAGDDARAILARFGFGPP